MDLVYCDKSSHFLDPDFLIGFKVEKLKIQQSLWFWLFDHRQQKVSQPTEDTSKSLLKVKKEKFCYLE